MANTDLAIKIATTLDATGLNKADKAVNKFNRTVGRLGRNLGLALGTTAIIAYGRASVKAFAADEAAAKRLSTAVDNLGLSLSQSRVTSFVKDLETSSAIADDVLRPALQALLTTTGSLTKSQELLSNAIQISRASGIDLATVSEDLAKGFVGVTRGLRKYNTGLTQAELKSKSFNEILGIMLARSAGAAEEYLTTTSYKLQVLAVAAGNAQETIGEGLVDALARIGGGTEASDAAKAINNIAKAINSITGAVGSAIGGVTKLYGKLNNFVQNFDPIIGGSIASENLTKSARSKSPAGTAARIAQQRQAEAAAAKRAQELAALTKKQVASSKALTAEQKKQTALKKAGSIFDLEQIQIIAALQGKLSKEDELRLKAQLALLNGNEVVATALTKQILMAQDQTGNLYKLFLALPDARNPFAYLEGYLDMLAGKAASILSTPAAVMAAPSSSQPSKIIVGGTIIDLPTTNVPAGGFSQLAAQGAGASGGFSSVVANAMAQQTVVVQIDGKAVASALQDSSLSGIGSTVNRTGG
jgi:hypothetical protein